MTGLTWDAIPLEMKWCRQWLLAGPNEKGELKVPLRVIGNKLVPASNKEPSHWMDFETCVEYAHLYGIAIGFVLTADDAYSCIDLDVKNIHNLPVETEKEKWTTQEQIDRFWKIVQAFESYTERSISMQGLHVWVRGKIGDGCKHDKVEVYSQERFMVCTGSVVIDKPIAMQQELLDILVKEIRERQAAGRGGALELIEIEETDSDAVLIERAINAANADKFNALCNCTSTDPDTGELGSFIEMGFRSQSEADLALMSMFTFYSRSNEQCRRLFRMSGLGKRAKATQDNRYLDLTLQLVRSRQAREDAISEQQRLMAQQLVQEIQLKQQAEQSLAAAQVSVSGAGAAQALGAPVSTDDGIGWPPGLVGAVAWHIYRNSPRPVKEVAIVSALGLIAGICGRSFQIPQSGLNLYIILVARSAIGKEAMHTGISNILSELREGCPPVQRFVDFADFASGPALSKAIAANKSFVNVAGEFGKKLKRLAREDGRDAAMQTLRTVMTNIYQKSAKTSVVGGLTYSDKESNVSSVSGVAYSMIGETTPSTFYNALTEDMMEDGFLSRFTVIEYKGDRPPLNENFQARMDPGLAQALHGLVVQSITLLDRFNETDVQFEQSAMQTIRDFNEFCDNSVRGEEREGYRQMWNRAHLKVLRIAALLAVADNVMCPMVYPAHVEWAMDLVKRDIQMFQNRMNSGDIGEGDNVRETKVMSLMRTYLTDGASGGYDVPIGLKLGGIIPRKILQIKCARTNCFMQHRLGSTAALDMTLRSLCDSGWIAEVDKTKLANDFSFHGKAYRILNLPSETGK